MDTDDQRITSYLVGDLPEAEQAELERQYFGDPAVVDRVIQAETRLLDAYARGELPDDVRERVARRYLTHPVRRERLKFAEALAATLDDLDPAVLQREKPTQARWQAALSWWGGPGRGVQLSMSLAVLMLLVTAGWLFVERIRLRDALNRVQEAHATQEQRERELAQQLTTERLNAEAVIAERDRLRAQQSNPSVVSLLFAIGGIRAPDDLPRTLKIPGGTEQVRFQLDLRESGYLNYAISVQAVGSKEILGRQGLQAVKTQSGWRLVLTAPAGRFAAGDYMLTLTGLTRDGDRDEVSKSIFRVER
jgi:anti-sigma factor RsiW